MSVEQDSATRLPPFNWGAFLVPPVWGLANGQWAGVFFVPLWLFVDNVLRGPRPFGTWSVAGGWLLAAVTLGIQAVYAAHANGHAWRRVAGSISLERFVLVQRRWAVAGLVTAALMAGGILMALQAPTP